MNILAGEKMAWFWLSLEMICLHTEVVLWSLVVRVAKLGFLK